MICTDAVLQQLKDKNVLAPVAPEVLDALLVRLDKAEVCAELLIRTGGRYCPEAVEWHKAAGK